LLDQPNLSNGKSHEEAVEEVTEPTIAQAGQTLTVAFQQSSINEDQSELKAPSADDELMSEKMNGAPKQHDILIKITLDTYRASKINSMISSLRMRIEPIETYNMECQKREAKVRKE
jgi:hypothetical protein